MLWFYRGLCAGTISWLGALTSWSLCWFPGNLMVMTRHDEVTATGQEIFPAGFREEKDFWATLLILLPSDPDKEENGSHTICWPEPPLKNIFDSAIHIY